MYRRSLQRLDKIEGSVWQASRRSVSDLWLGLLLGHNVLHELFDLCVCATQVEAWQSRDGQAL